MRVKRQTISSEFSKRQGKNSLFSIRKPLSHNASGLRSEATKAPARRPRAGKTLHDPGSESRDTNQWCFSPVTRRVSSRTSSRPAPSRGLATAQSQPEMTGTAGVFRFRVAISELGSHTAQTVCVPTRASGHCEGSPILPSMGRKPPRVLLALSKGRSAVPDGRSSRHWSASCFLHKQVPKPEAHPLWPPGQLAEPPQRNEAERDGGRHSGSPHPAATRKCRGNRAHGLSHSEGASPP